MEAEDLVAPFELGLGQSCELGERVVGVYVEECSERLIRLVVSGCEVDAVEVLEHPPPLARFGLNPCAGNRVSTTLCRRSSTIGRMATALPASYSLLVGAAVADRL